MEIEFSSRKELQWFEKGMKELQRHFGVELPKRITQRIAELRAAENLAQISKLPPPRCHKLTNNLKDIFSVDLKGKYRLLFVPNYLKETLPKLENGEVDLRRVKKIKITDLCTDKTHR